MAVRFHFLDRKVLLQNRRQLKSFIELLFKREMCNLNTLTYVFCSDSYLLKINQEFLNHNFFTDIITFDMSSSKELIDGEVYISIDRVRENAQIMGVTISNELHRVIFHGALHLCGYQDKINSEIKVIREKEDTYLNLFFK
jgi:probable rRNA maturation factor